MRTLVFGSRHTECQVGDIQGEGSRLRVGIHLSIRSNRCCVGETLVNPTTFIEAQHRARGELQLVGCRQRDGLVRIGIAVLVYVVGTEIDAPHLLGGSVAHRHGSLFGTYLLSEKQQLVVFVQKIGCLAACYGGGGEGFVANGEGGGDSAAYNDVILG